MLIEPNEDMTLDELEAALCAKEAESEAQDDESLATEGTPIDPFSGQPGTDGL